MSTDEELLKEVREEIKTLREQVRALDALIRVVIRLCHGCQAEGIRRDHERACRRMEEWRVSNLHRSRSPQ